MGVWRNKECFPKVKRIKRNLGLGIEVSFRVCGSLRERVMEGCNLVTDYEIKRKKTELHLQSL